MNRSQVIYIDPKILERIERGLSRLLERTHAASISFVDGSGVVLASAGEPLLHPQQLGPVAAGIFGAMGAMIRASRSDEFFVRLPQSMTNLQFQHVDLSAFLVAYYSDPSQEESIRAALKKMAMEARGALTLEQTQEDDRHAGHVTFIEDKLNEIFGE